MYTSFVETVRAFRILAKVEEGPVTAKVVKE
jgi:hypothetical protein